MEKKESYVREGTLREQTQYQQAEYFLVDLVYKLVFSFVNDFSSSF